MLELLEMDPGPEFGRLLRRIQSAIVGRGTMPLLKKTIRQEIEKRAEAFYHRSFVKGD
jgi:hypothetical protein